MHTTDAVRLGGPWAEALDDLVIGAVPDWGGAALDEFHAQVTNAERPFPCTFGVSALRRGHLRFAFVEDSPGQSEWPELPGQLASYLETYREIAQITSFVTFFRPAVEGLGLDTLEERFWATLQYLHDHDPSPWPDDVPQDPEDPAWEFCFGGHPIFVVCNTPAHDRRQSRWNSAMVITFQPRTVFDGLDAGTPRGDAARRVIRRRLADYDEVEACPVLGPYGHPGYREWKQYFLPNDNEADSPERRCPLRIAAGAR
jgi:FPC/CPF motif-containing protein YcgG